MTVSYGSFGPGKAPESPRTPVTPTGLGHRSMPSPLGPAGAGLPNLLPPGPRRFGSHAHAHAAPTADDLFPAVPKAPLSLRSPSAGSVRRTGSFWNPFSDEHEPEHERSQSRGRKGRASNAGTPVGPAPHQPGLMQLQYHDHHTGYTLAHPPAVLLTPQMRSQRLIGNSNPRYRWHRYFKTEQELKEMRPPIREYYERNNSLILQYIYIDKLLDSSLPQNLIEEYHHPSHANVDVPPTISEEPAQGNSYKSATASETGRSGNEENSDGQGDIRSANSASATSLGHDGAGSGTGESPLAPQTKLKRTPRNLYKLPTSESTPLLPRYSGDFDDEEAQIGIPEYSPDDEDVQSTDRIVTIAIRANMLANVILLLMKIAVTVMTNSVSVLASLVDAVLDFLSTAIVWTTTALISRQDHYAYPAGRRRLEPIGVLVFSVIMVTSFFQVGIEGLGKLTSGSREVVYLPGLAIAIMAATVVVKLACWFSCRLIKNSSVQALAQDAMTDVVFNIFSIIFPLTGYAADIWWLDPLGGIVLSLYVIVSWSGTSMEHIRKLSGQSATADQRNVLLYLTMRFARSIRHIQGLQAYHGGDKLIAEVDVVLDENMTLRDSHDLGESLQYVLESVPIVDRAFVHLDYAPWNLPTHMSQQE